MKLEGLNSKKFTVINHNTMQHIVGGGNNISGPGNYGKVKASNDYIDCNGKLWVGAHENYDFTPREIEIRKAEIC